MPYYKLNDPNGNNKTKVDKKLKDFLQTINKDKNTPYDNFVDLFLDNIKCIEYILKFENIEDVEGNRKIKIINDVDVDKYIKFRNQFFLDKEALVLLINNCEEDICKKYAGAMSKIFERIQDPDWMKKKEGNYTEEEMDRIKYFLYGLFKFINKECTTIYGGECEEVEPGEKYLIKLPEKEEIVKYQIDISHEYKYEKNDLNKTYKTLDHIRNFLEKEDGLVDYYPRNEQTYKVVSGWKQDGEYLIPEKKVNDNSSGGKKNRRKRYSVKRKKTAKYRKKYTRRNKRRTKRH
jgi:hypothetical protein